MPSNAVTAGAREPNPQNSFMKTSVNIQQRVTTRAGLRLQRSQMNEKGGCRAAA